MTTGSEKKTPANLHKKYQVARDALPVSCPLPEMELWNAHPRVYLAIEPTGEARCPYCGAHYFLID